MKPGVLYVSYDGMLEPLGQSQVLAYLERLAAGHRIHLISYEKPEDWADTLRRVDVAGRIAAAGISWHPLRYHKWPTAPATGYDVAAGIATALALVVRHRLSIIHARSYVAAAIALAVKRATGARFLFDMRGFWADERVDGGLWTPSGRLYRLAKNLERRFLEAADHIITLTHAAKGEIRGFPYLADRSSPISVIPTCADLRRFDIQGPPARSPFVLGYAGSAWTWNVLDETLRCFQLLSEQVPGARLLMINRKEQDRIRTRVRALGIDLGNVEIRAADHGDVPSLIARMSAGIAMYKPAYSNIAKAPTKLAEYLGCGVPCFGNAGVGDLELILEQQRVGVAVQDLSDEQLRPGVTRLIELCREEGLQQRCRQVALDLFSLERGSDAYDRIYRQLAQPGQLVGEPA